jgi:hypothetical protein
MTDREAQREALGGRSNGQTESLVGNPFPLGPMGERSCHGSDDQATAGSD